jgi:hypothetical protein
VVSPPPAKPVSSPRAFALSRLRIGESLAGLAAVALLVLLLAVHWYGGRRIPPATGWEALTVTRWVALVTIAAGLALPLTQATRRAPAVPASLSVIVLVLGIVLTVILLIRVVIDLPGPDELVSARAGAYLGLAGAVAIAAGGFLSLRQEGVARFDERTEIETVVLGGARES